VPAEAPGTKSLPNVNVSRGINAAGVLTGKTNMLHDWFEHHARQFYIDGRWTMPHGSHTRAVINPATENAIATISLGSDADVDAAVAAAKAAFETFAKTTVEERLALMYRVAETFEKYAPDMAAIITSELGCPIDLSRDGQTAVGAVHIQDFIKTLGKHDFEREVAPGFTIAKEPIGVCALITPWNWPLNQIALKVLPALAAGCTMILKPSELTPLSALLFAHILHEAGTPKGVFNLVNGDGPVVGSALSKHPDVALVSFTGSTRAGCAVSIDAASTIKRVTLELGGKSPNLIFDGVDLPNVIQRSVRHCFENSGQSCDAPTRMLVERRIYDKAVELARRAAEGQVVADPQKPGDHIGPVVSATQFDRIQTLIKVGIHEGARLLVGGPGKPDGIDTGFYVRPTIFADVSNDMRIAREEIFGPVLVIIPFDDEDDAVRIANDSPYGLAAYVQCLSASKADRVARRLRAGIVRVNGAAIPDAAPFGGYKASGIGREGGHSGMDEFLEIKTIAE
jgi:aldehyde dehydrogenase (NAD+)